VSSVHVKFRDVPDAAYLSSNEEVQQGEICICGPSVVKGYYKRDELNNDEPTFIADGRWVVADRGTVES